MRLARFAVDGEPKLGVAAGNVLIDLRAGAALLGVSQPNLCAFGDSMRQFLQAGKMAIAAAVGIQRAVLGMLSEGRLPRTSDGSAVAYDSNEVRLLSPVADPEKFLLLGLNYRDHVEETKQDYPTVPVVFAKFRNAIVGHGEAVVLPKAAPLRVDYEAELAFVVGQRARRVALEDAYAYIAGYCAVNDVTARDLQKSQSQWVLGKSIDTFAPVGPHLVTADEIPDPNDLAIRCFVNGTLLQDSNTSNLIFDVPYLLHHLSQLMTLEPGDIVSTGTPGGVGFARRPPIYLRPGDIVRVEVEGIGLLENRITLEE